ncbi:MAG: hypothetical protein AABY53_08865 [Bdellovibrionota bacterium]
MRKINLRSKISIMGIICLILAYGVWNWSENQINFLLSNSKSGLERMAQVKTSSSNVTRNHNGQLLWQDIGAGEVIYMGNAIQTEKDSSAEIILDEGENIFIGPESFVRFVRVGGRISLDLVEGKIEIKSPDTKFLESMRLKPKKSSNLVIKTPQGQLALNDASLKLQADKSEQQNVQKNFKVEVLSGTPELTTLLEKQVLAPPPEAEKIEVKAVDVEAKQTKSEVIPEAEVKPEQLAETPSEPVVEPPTSPAIERQPAEAIAPAPVAAPTTPLTAPKVKSIKVKEVE